MNLRKKATTVGASVLVLGLLALAVVVSYEYGAFSNKDVAPLTAQATPEATKEPSGVLAPQSVPSLLETEAVELINERRVAAGLGTLHATYPLSAAARYFAADIGHPGLCQHEPVWSSLSFGIPPTDRSRRLGYPWWKGEAIACGHTNAEEAVEAWWQSPPHRLILLHPTINEVGVGVYERSDGAIYWVAETGQVK